MNLLKLAIVVLSMSCATVGARPINADGTPAPFPSEMAEGRRDCSLMCQAAGLTFQEYRTDGKCICQEQ